MLSIEVLLPPQHGVIERLKVLGGIGVAEEPVESRPDEQRAEERSLGVVGFGEEQLLCPGESLGIELLQGWVGGDQRVLQSSGPEAEFLSVFALQHRGEPTGRGAACGRGHDHQHRRGPGNLLTLCAQSTLPQDPCCKVWLGAYKRRG